MWVRLRLCVHVCERKKEGEREREKEGEGVKKFSIVNIMKVYGH